MEEEMREGKRKRKGERDELGDKKGHLSLRAPKNGKDEVV